MQQVAMAEFLHLLGDQVLEATVDPKSWVTNISYSSKEIGPGGLFFCKGRAFQKAYLEEAVDRGALAYVSEVDYQVAIPHLLVQNIRQTLAPSAALFYGHPEEKLKIYAVTATKGKSSTVWYAKAILDQARRRTGGPQAGLLSSIVSFDGLHTEKSKLTTPEPFELFSFLSRAVDHGLKEVFMEVSSQALKYGRTAGIPFQVAAFLNIGLDHISSLEHPDFADYFASKLSIFSQAKKAILNARSDHFQEILDGAKTTGEVLVFSLEEKAGSAIWASDIQEEDGLSANFHYRGETFPIRLPELGLFSLENLLAACLLAFEAGAQPEDVLPAVCDLHIPGRMEKIEAAGGNLVVLVDFAHNALSYQAIFDTVDHRYPGAKKILVFGAPGEKAINRRRQLGQLAAKHADRILLTSDDPAGEDPKRINQEIAKGLGAKDYLEILDRKEAIEKALDLAREELREGQQDGGKEKDGPSQEMASKGQVVVLLLGKGSDRTMPVGGKDLPYQGDGPIARAWLKEHSKFV